MTEFEITREWLETQMVRAIGAKQVTLPGYQMRALLAAAYRGLGFAPSADILPFPPGKR